MSQPIYVADAFTDHAFGGNPAAVCVMVGPADEAWMKNVAAEMNLSETAFLFPEGAGWRLRWLTPTVEVELCGHATLASAHILWETGRLRPDAEARFLTKSGALLARRVGDEIELDFPVRPVQECDPPASLAEGLGCRAEFVGKNGMDFLVELADAAAVRRLQPNHRLLQSLKVRGIIVTAKSDDPTYHFVSRFFAPGSGIDEDPVTGSAHCALAPYWSPKLGLNEMVGYQASKRGGVVKVALKGDRVLLIGKAVTVLAGELKR